MTPEERLSSHVEWLRGDHEQCNPWLADEIERLRNRVAELEEAIDSQEIDAGFTSNGNMWRFWSKKCREHLDKRKAAEAEWDRLRAVIDGHCSGACELNQAASPTGAQDPVPCGGCGETNPDNRCIGCLHPFYPGDASWPARS